ncbi:kynureninase [Kocuria sp.]|uniref:kynureninase n=1 Tax=Kocuria sp. TaxID=1871328 RepID=UPI0026E0E58B|nr:aminotransferase class V-fold PLP-dependent enzyme [Kocuria sp.]MDO5619760.1 aminotransferase class V-fold PLP-dependent enzyme [Kocuria sp.]
MKTAEVASTRYAAELDAADSLAAFRHEFVPNPQLVAYLDGNSLGRPTLAADRRLQGFAADEWGDRLIRGWDEGWFDLPLTLGDRLGSAVLGSAPGQTFMGESTTVILYKLIHAALTARPDRTELVVDTDNFPTDRYLVQGIAADRGLTVRWIEPDPAAGVTPEQVAQVVNERTALVLLSQVAYRSGYLSDVAAITGITHDVGALALWDLCHSAGVMEINLDAWGVDLAAGCTYKYLNGGPGSAAFGYVRSELITQMQQPIQGWMGAANAFQMGPQYQADAGIRRFISGTPSIMSMLPLAESLGMIEQAGVPAIRAKSVALTDYALELYDALLAPLGVRLGSPRDAGVRGGHLTVLHDSFEEILPQLWERGVIPDFRRPNGLRLGLSPLSTSFEETRLGVVAILDALRAVTENPA